MTEAPWSSARRGTALDAIVVLGCAALLDGDGRLADGALARRVRAAALAYRRGGHGRTVVLVSGGRRWGRHLEADVMAEELVRRGVPRSSVVRERCSLTTRDNARFASAMLRRRGISSAGVVTCAFHMPRALGLFARAGIAADPVASGPEPRVHALSRVLRWTGERALLIIDTPPGMRRLAG